MIIEKRFEVILNDEETVTADMIASAMSDEVIERKEEFICPDRLHIVPLIRRPFFPGMISPIVIEKGVYYEMLKKVAKSKIKNKGYRFIQKPYDIKELLKQIHTTIN